jgi:uncharacterized membrane protein
MSEAAARAAPDADERKSVRIPAVDVLRGAALAAMFVYHLTWDFAYFRLIQPEVIVRPVFKMFGHAIAASFLLLVGAGMALAYQGRMKPRPYWRRLGQIAAAAAAVTAATLVVFPDRFIFFGILHCIVAATLVATPFLKAPVWATAAAGFAIILAPLLVVHPMFDQPPFWWTGLGVEQPPSNDWRPFFPWTGFALLGLAATRIAQRGDLLLTLARWRAGDPLSRLLAFGGRHSLAVYLLHQPIFIAVIFVTLKLVSPVSDPQESSFTSACETQCSVSADAMVCRRFCACMVRDLRSAGLWERMRGAASDADRERIDALTLQCSRAAAGAGQP